MHSSNPATSRTQARLASEPAVPITRDAPRLRATWPATDPVAPAAAVTKHGVAFDRLADVLHAEVGRHAGHAGHAEHQLRVVDLGGNRGELCRWVGVAVEVDQRVRLPVQCAVDELSGPEARMLGGDHLADSPRPHHLADCDGRHVRADIVEPSALSRLEREPQRAHEHLALLRVGDRLLDELEAVVGDDPGRTAPKHELLIDAHGHDEPPPRIW